MDVLCDRRDAVGESPLWSPDEQALYWVDIEAPGLSRLDWSSRRLEHWRCPERIACIALHAGGGLVAGMESGIFHLHPRPHGVLEHRRLASVAHAAADMRFNDGRCDRAGRFWAGTMVRDMALARPAGVLHRFDAGGLSAPLVDGLITPNGLAFSPDGRRMYLSDSHPQVRRVWAFDLDEQGRPGGRREFIDMNRHPGRPDGAAVDSDGGYWICANDAGQVHRFTPDGRLDRSLSVPVSKPAMCAFGGPALDLLFITTIRPAVPPPGQAALAGAVFVTRPGAHGIAEVAFRG